MGFYLQLYQFVYAINDDHKYQHDD